MKSKIAAAAAALIIGVLFSSCYQVFTSSAFEWAKPDISQMSAEQQVSYAEDLLTTGTKEEQAAALTEIQELLPADLSTADSDLLLLAADLAVGSSGMGEAVDSMLEMATSTTDATPESQAEMMETLAAAISSIDTSNLASAVDYVAAAEASGATLTSEQYANAAAAQLLVVVNGDIANIATVNPEDPGLAQAMSWAESAEIDIESLLTGGLSI